ncbi:DNA topoisomerase IB [Pseudaestuariivita atlantica]|uniref:DNA topoisomerase n=1 Tax=Pseudaestuariivita atlantica TaxID=1317121 RepID=A0A0L1JLU6_9RHOB|nr:DNA topoisomerase IB [Pseudaestuariivita atlantica]KNG92378.1 DNA topoisomerase [Pseudaestuariivita atlantica]
MSEPLRYYPDDQPGILRRRCGRGFSYVAPDGTRIDRGAERKRLDALAVPPAYDDVWMSPFANGHLQATGRDARRRKQYRYHPVWVEERARDKYADLPAFGEGLPRLRRRIRADLKGEAGEERFALAAAAALIDRMALRAGSEAYTEQNGSYGALTLRNRHLTLDGSKVRLDYTAKGGQRVRKARSDRTLARALEAVQDHGGATLFSFVGADGAVRSLRSETLNAYLAEHTATNATAKTFRTWAGSVAAFDVARQGGATIKAMAAAAAERLHNTPTIARNSYIHPEVIALAGGEALGAADPPAELTQAEAGFLDLLA